MSLDCSGFVAKVQIVGLKTTIYAVLYSFFFAIEVGCDKVNKVNNVLKLYVFATF